MNFLTFKNAFEKSSLIFTNDINKRFPDFDNHRLSDWQSKGYIRKLINRFYIWPQMELDEMALYSIANRIYKPSYISLKSALRYYNFIPEGVYQQFSISTRKTKTFETELGVFNYKNVKTDLYFGYYPLTPEKGGYLIAEPEKALIDTFYLNPKIEDALDLESLRFNYGEIKELCDTKKLKKYTAIVDNKRVSQLIEILIKLVEND